MNIKKTFLLVVIVTLVGTLVLVGCGEADNSGEKESDLTWGDNYKALIESGEKSDFKDFKDMKEELDQIREKTGATYVYAMSPAKDEEASLDGATDKKGSFLITVDGSLEPDDWGTDYGWEIQFEEAWNKTPAAARSGWNDGPEEVCWSAFAPVYDSEGNVVAILGIDYPANEILNYPQWNRDAKEWNKIEESLEGVDVPKKVKDLMDKVTNLADKYAKELSK